MTEQPDWHRARDVLCIRLDGLGDLLMTSPAIRALKQAHADRKITLLTSPAGAEASALLPEIDEVITYDAPWMKATNPRHSSRSDLALIDRLRQRYDAAIIFTVFSQSALPAAMMCYLADIPLRLAHGRENPYQLLTHWAPDSEPEQGIRHEVRRQLDLVAGVGCTLRDERIRVRIPNDAEHRVANLLERIGIESAAPIVLVHPGASAASRRYPSDGYAIAVRELAQRQLGPVIFSGSVGECELIEEIQRNAAVRTHSLAGQLSLPMLAALIARASVLVTNNTGPAHLAAATGTPLVDLYALTNPQHTPWRVASRVLFHDVPCKYCYKSICPEGHHDCLRLVPPSAIVNAVEELQLADCRLPIEM